MSSNGMKTGFWGPHAWGFLFSSIAGTYPVRVDMSNKEHTKTVKAFQNMFKSLEHTLPCIYCRQSYGKFIKELPLSSYEHSRQGMMQWLYLIHDRVNEKLIKQEKECYEAEKHKLTAKKMTPAQLKSALKILKSDIMKTKPSPSFERVVAMYEKQRAKCRKKTNRCS